MSAYTELEVSLHRLDTRTGQYQAELRFSDPGTEAEVPPERGPVALDVEELRTLHFDPEAYGRKLADGLFNADNLRALWTRARTATESGGNFLRVHLLVDQSALELHALRWELLTDPETGRPLATSERTLFSRFMVSNDWRPVRLRAKAALKALIAVSAPSDIERFKLAPADVEGEIRRARESLGDVEATVAGQDEPLTLDLLLERLRAADGGVDILYLVCHGMLSRGNVPFLLFQDEDGKGVRVEGEKLALGVAELQRPPRLAFLASCQSARREETTTDDGKAAAESALAPRLADAGVAAVVAMQGNVSMDTVDKAMPVFFRELMQDGQIDRAMTVARAKVRDRQDSWMPALYLRLKHGLLWSVDSNGWAKLKTLDQDAREAVRSEIGPGASSAGLRLPRAQAAAALRDRIAENPYLLIYGESGAGKSALVLSELVASEKPDKLQVFFLNLRLLPRNIPEFRVAIGCTVEDVLHEMSASVRLLVIDSGGCQDSCRIFRVMAHSDSAGRASGLR